MARLFRGKYSPSIVEGLWEAQIRSFVQYFGHPPHGINSHEHIHLFPPFFTVALRLAQKYRISFIRLGEKRESLALNPRSWLNVLFHRSNYQKLKRAQLSTSLHVYSLDNKIPSILAMKTSLDDNAEIIAHHYMENDLSFIRSLNCVEG